MKNRIIFHIKKDFKLKRSSIITFTGTISTNTSPFATPSIEFNGVDISDVGNAIIPEEMLIFLKEEFQNHFGYAPYTRKEINKKIKEKGYFILEYQV